MTKSTSKSLDLTTARFPSASGITGKALGRFAPHRLVEDKIHLHAGVGQEMIDKYSCVTFGCAMSST
jgi:hypothetical protein